MFIKVLINGYGRDWIKCRFRYLNNAVKPQRAYSPFVLDYACYYLVFLHLWPADGMHVSFLVNVTSQMNVLLFSSRRWQSHLTWLWILQAANLDSMFISTVSSAVECVHNCFQGKKKNNPQDISSITVWNSQGGSDFSPSLCR